MDRQLIDTFLERVRAAVPRWHWEVIDDPEAGDVTVLYRGNLVALLCYDGITDNIVVALDEIEHLVQEHSLETK